MRRNMMVTEIWHVYAVDFAEVMRRKKRYRVVDGQQKQASKLFHDTLEGIKQYPEIAQQPFFKEMKRSIADR